MWFGYKWPKRDRETERAARMYVFEKIRAQHTSRYMWAAVAAIILSVWMHRICNTLCRKREFTTCATMSVCDTIECRCLIGILYYTHTAIRLYYTRCRRRIHSQKWIPTTKREQQQQQRRRIITIGRPRHSGALMPNVKIDNESKM